MIPLVPAKEVLVWTRRVQVSSAPSTPSAFTTASNTPQKSRVSLQEEVLDRLDQGSEKSTGGSRRWEPLQGSEMVHQCFQSRRIQNVSVLVSIKHLSGSHSWFWKGPTHISRYKQGSTEFTPKIQSSSSDRFSWRASCQSWLCRNFHSTRYQKLPTSY